MDGIINLYKPGGITSHDATSKIKRLFGTRRVGHAGTLDPMATGVLPVLVGRATLVQDYIMSKEKSYRAGMHFGTLTDTGDVTGNVLSTARVDKNQQEIISAANSFVGKISQVPPMYSAIKVDGKKLYELAREGMTVERRAREVEIYSIDFVEKISDTDYVFDISCSKGTYIRTLCEDIGNSLGCGATLFSLERTKSGIFKKEESVTIEELETAQNSGGASELSKFLIPTKSFFQELPQIKLPEFYSKLCKNGCEIYLSKLKLDEKSYPNDTLVGLVDSDGEFFAVGRIGTYKQGCAVKATIRLCE